jgi:hypothetical protein
VRKSQEKIGLLDCPGPPVTLIVFFGMDFEVVHLLHASGDEDATTGGVEQQYCIDGEVLGSIISGDGSSLPAVVARLGIGRAAFNKLL